MILLIAAGAFIVFGYMKYNDVTNQKNVLSDNNKKLEESLKITEENVRTLQDEKEKIAQELSDEQRQVKTISKTVTNLEKLRDTDPELLRKYSKVYFLNEHYTPRQLEAIDSEYMFPVGKKAEILSDVAPFLQDLLDDAKQEGIPLRISWAYRSFETQQAIKTEDKVTYGAGTANQFVADQGYSEHQLGTTVDFTTPTASGTAFENSPAYTWLNQNAYKYGFVISYPKNNTYYTFEPWHWRFVGMSLARRLHRDEKYFYDLDQREIDTYLLKIFN